MWMLCTALVLLIPVDQGHPETTNDHRATVMGFDQDKTAHHFLLYADGGDLPPVIRHG